MAEEPAAAKACILCREDLAGKPHHTDSKGRSICPPCFDRAKAAKAAHQRKQAVRAARPASIPLANDEPDLSGITEESARPVSLRAQAECPKCGKPLIFDAVVCNACGFDRVSLAETGSSTVEVERYAAPEPEIPMLKGACGKCGYSLAGIKSLRCPECGSQNRYRKSSDRLPPPRPPLLSRAYIYPAAVAAIGLGLAATVHFFVFPSNVITYADVGIIHGVGFALGLIGYYGCAAAMGGFGIPFLLVITRLAAAFGAMSTVLSFTGVVVPFCLASLLIPMTAHYMALGAFMEGLDRDQVRVLAVSTCLLNWAGMLVALALIVQ